MTIKTLLGMGPNNRNNSGSSWTFGWTPSQASALSGNVKNAAKREAGHGDAQSQRALSAGCNPKSESRFLPLLAAGRLVI